MGRHTTSETARSDDHSRGPASSLVNRPLTGYDAPETRARRNSRQVPSRRHLLLTGSAFLLVGSLLWATDAILHGVFWVEDIGAYLLLLIFGMAAWLIGDRPRDAEPPGDADEP